MRITSPHKVSEWKMMSYQFRLVLLIPSILGSFSSSQQRTLRSTCEKTTKFVKGDQLDSCLNTSSHIEFLYTVNEVYTLILLNRNNLFFPHEK